MIFQSYINKKGNEREKKTKNENSKSNEKKNCMKKREHYSFLYAYEYILKKEEVYERVYTIMSITRFLSLFVLKAYLKEKKKLIVI
jgi:hypothetical protein